MQALLALSRVIDALNERVGRSVSWLVLVAVVISAGNAIVRKAFDMSSNAYLEMQWYLFAAVFLLCAACTLRLNEHIRIDVIDGRLLAPDADPGSTSSARSSSWCRCLLVRLRVVAVVRARVRERELSPAAGGLVLWPAKAPRAGRLRAAAAAGASRSSSSGSGSSRGCVPTPRPDGREDRGGGTRRGDPAPARRGGPLTIVSRPPTASTPWAGARA